MAGLAGMLPQHLQLKVLAMLDDKVRTRRIVRPSFSKENGRLGGERGIWREVQWTSDL